MRSKSQTAWETAARCAALAQEADNSEEREYYDRLHDAWPYRKRPDHPMVQSATLVVLVLSAGLMLTTLTVRLRDGRQRSRLGRVEATILVQRFDIERGNHTADLRDQEQEKKQWTKAFEPAKYSPLPPPG